MATAGLLSRSSGGIFGDDFVVPVAKVPKSRSNPLLSLDRPLLLFHHVVAVESVVALLRLPPRRAQQRVSIDSADSYMLTPS